MNIVTATQTGLIVQSTLGASRAGRWARPPFVPDQCYECLEQLPGEFARPRAATGYVMHEPTRYPLVRYGTCDHCRPERPTDRCAVKPLDQLELELRRWYVDHPGQDINYADIAEIYEALSFFTPLLRYGLSRVNSHSGWLVRMINAAKDRARAASQTLEVSNDAVPAL